MYSCNNRFTDGPRRNGAAIRQLPAGLDEQAGGAWSPGFATKVFGQWAGIDRVLWDDQRHDGSRFTVPLAQRRERPEGGSAEV
jgi:hypothetical protein